MDAVSEAGASEMMREVNIRKRFALLYHLSFLIYPLAKRLLRAWGERLLSKAKFSLSGQARNFLWAETSNIPF